MTRHILAPLDGSNLAECVLPHIVAQARAVDGRVTLLRVLDQGATDGAVSINPVNWRLVHAQGQRYLDEVAERLRDAGLDDVTTELLEGRAAERIISYVDEHDVDLVILSSHGRSGLYQWNVSSVVQKTIFQANSSILIVRAYRPPSESLRDFRYKRILVPLDCSQRAECVLPVARHLTQHSGSTIDLAHVVRPPSFPRQAPLSEHEQELIDEVVELNTEMARDYLEEVRSRLAVDSKVHLLQHPDIAAALHELVDDLDVDLVLVCAHGYTGTRKFPFASLPLNFISYGSTPLQVVQDLPDERYQSMAEAASKEYKGH